MKELEASAELNRLVAEAVAWNRQCDWEYTGLSDYEYSVYRCRNCGDVDLSDMGDGEPQKCTPLCSTVLDAAFAAAESARLFESYVLAWVDGVWRITPARRFAHPVFAIGNTPALAICRAILKLKDQSDDRRPRRMDPGG